MFFLQSDAIESRFSLDYIGQIFMRQLIEGDENTCALSLLLALLLFSSLTRIIWGNPDHSEAVKLD